MKPIYYETQKQKCGGNGIFYAQSLKKCRDASPVSTHLIAPVHESNYFRSEMRGYVKNNTSQSALGFSPKHQTSEIYLRISYLMSY